MDDIQHRDLLRIARATICAELGDVSQPSSPTVSFSGSFSGAFVTLRHGKRLRGCMGTFEPRSSLDETVRVVARLACKDPRFKADPITPAELTDVRIEVSILGRLERTSEPQALQVGTHGILIRSGDHSGCFLPQVAEEHGWNAEEFLSRCCSMKCGLPPEAWRQPDTQVELFTAEVFAEECDADSRPLACD